MVTCPVRRPMVRRFCVGKLISQQPVLGVRCMSQLAEARPVAEARPAAKQDLANFMRWVHRCNTGVLHTLVPWHAAGCKPGDADAAAPHVLGYLRPEYALRLSLLDCSITCFENSETASARRQEFAFDSAESSIACLCRFSQRVLACGNTFTRLPAAGHPAGVLQLSQHLTDPESRTAALAGAAQLLYSCGAYKLPSFACNALFVRCGESGCHDLPYTLHMATLAACLSTTQVSSGLQHLTLCA